MKNKIFLLIFLSVSAFFVYLLYGKYGSSKTPSQLEKKEISGVAAKSVNSLPENKHEGSASTIEKSANESPGELGDVTRKFRSALKCHADWQAIATLGDKVNACEGYRYAPDSYDKCLKEIPGYNESIQKKLNEVALCSNDQKKIDSDYYQFTKSAAANGDIDAQLCYMQGNFRFSSPNQLSDEDINQYKADTSRYLDDALRRGDWRAVSLMSIDGHYLYDMEGLIEYVVPGDPATTYKMNRLLRLGATGNYVNLLDSIAYSLGTQLPKRVREEADAWAKQEYEQYFSRSPALSAAPVICAD